MKVALALIGLVLLLLFRGPEARLAATAKPGPMVAISDAQNGTPHCNGFLVQLDQTPMIITAGHCNSPALAARYARCAGNTCEFDLISERFHKIGVDAGAIVLKKSSNLTKFKNVSAVTEFGSLGAGAISIESHLFDNGFKIQTAKGLVQKTCEEASPPCKDQLAADWEETVEDGAGRCLTTYAYAALHAPPCLIPSTSGSRVLQSEAVVAVHAASSGTTIAVVPLTAAVIQGGLRAGPGTVILALPAKQ